MTKEMCKEYFKDLLEADTTEATADVRAVRRNKC
jgi:hypothetical protein